MKPTTSWCVIDVKHALRAAPIPLERCEGYNSTVTHAAENDARSAGSQRQPTVAACTNLKTCLFSPSSTAPSRNACRYGISQSEFVW